MTREIHVYGDWRPLAGPERIGLLRAAQVHGSETFSFEYDTSWLDKNSAWYLDPELLLYQGPQYLSSKQKPNFGIFLDSSPDRWGRLLIRRRESVLARQEGRESRTLFESDSLRCLDTRTERVTKTA